MSIKIAIIGGNYLFNLMKMQVGETVELTDITDMIFLKKRNKISKAIQYCEIIRDYDMVVNFYVTKQAAILAHLAHIMGKPFVAYWIGTDVYDFFHSRRFSTKVFDSNWAYSYSLKEELEPIVFPVEKITLYPLQIDYSLAEMPKEHAVMMYIPEGREDFYNLKLAQELANSFPSLRFHIVANGRKELFPQPNVIVHGYISPEEMNNLFNQISIVVRAPKHDGQSLSIMEGQLKGKYVVYNMPFPYTIQAHTVDDFKGKIREIISQDPQVQLEVHNFAVQECDPQKGRENLLRLIKSVKRRKIF